MAQDKIHIIIPAYLSQNTWSRKRFKSSCYLDMKALAPVQFSSRQMPNNWGIYLRQYMRLCICIAFIGLGIIIVLLTEFMVQN